VGGREYVEITEILSGTTFRFYMDRAQGHRLHISVRWGIAPETAIRTFLDARAQLVWLPQKECFETRALAHVLVWLRVAPQHILVITCVPREVSQSALTEAEGDSA